MLCYRFKICVKPVSWGDGVTLQREIGSFKRDFLKGKTKQNTHPSTHWPTHSHTHPSPLARSSQKKPLWHHRASLFPIWAPSPDDQFVSLVLLFKFQKDRHLVHRVAVLSPLPIGVPIPEDGSWVDAFGNEQVTRTSLPSCPLWPWATLLISGCPPGSVN